MGKKKTITGEIVIDVWINKIIKESTIKTSL